MEKWKFPKKIKIKPYHIPNYLSNNNIFIAPVSQDILKYSKFTVLSQIFHHMFFSNVVSQDNSTNSKKSRRQNNELALYLLGNQKNAKNRNKYSKYKIYLTKLEKKVSLND